MLLVPLRLEGHLMDGVKMGRVMVAASQGFEAEVCGKSPGKYKLQ